MTLNRVVVYLLLVAATAVLAVLFALEGIWYSVAYAILSGVMWLVGEWKQWRWLSSIGFAFIVLGAVGAVFLEGGLIWGITAVTLALISWDGSRLNDFLAQTKRVEEENKIRRQYWRRILVIAVLGFLFALSTTLFSLDFGFLVALPLSCLTIIGFSLAISFLRRHSD